MEMEDGKTCTCETIKTKSADSTSPTKPLDCKRVVKTAAVLSTVVVAFVVLYFASVNNFGEGFPSFFDFDDLGSTSSLLESNKTYELMKVLDAAATKDKTVILTTLNGAWAAPNSIFDVFLESFKVGNNTAKLLDHLVVVAVDEDAYARCNATLAHCYLLKTKRSSEMAHEAVFMTPIYMDMMWERLAFLQTILSLGYNFVFTDMDIMWFRNPFQHFNPNSDFQTSCDVFNGKELDLRNSPNNGFLFVRSNHRTINFYKFWVSSRHNFPGLNEQQVFNIIKTGPYVRSIELRIRFLDTDFFGGYCSPSKSFSKVCTMHANCCVGLGRKIADLRTTIEDWKNYFHSNRTGSQPSHWRVPRKCHM